MGKWPRYRTNLHLPPEPSPTGTISYRSHLLQNPRPTGIIPTGTISCVENYQLICDAAN